MEYVPLSRLKGINVYLQDDLYNMARMKLELNDARAKYMKSATISRPTVRGLVSIFASFIDQCNPDNDRVLAAIESHKFPMNIPINFDDEGQKDIVSGRVFHIRAHTNRKK